MRTVTRRVTGGALALSAGVLPFVAAPAPGHAANPNPSSECTALGCAGVQIACSGHLCKITGLAYGYPPDRLTTFTWTWNGPQVSQNGLVFCGNGACVIEAYVGAAQGGKHTACVYLGAFGSVEDYPSACADISLK